MGFGNSLLEVFGHSRRALSELPESILLTKTTESRELLQQMNAARQATVEQKDQFTSVLQQGKEKKKPVWTRIISVIGFGDSRQTAKQTLGQIKQSKTDLKHAKKCLKTQTKAANGAKRRYSLHIGEVEHQLARAKAYLAPYEAQVRLASETAHASGDDAAIARLRAAEHHRDTASASTNVFQDAMNAHNAFSTT